MDTILRRPPRPKVCFSTATILKSRLIPPATVARLIATLSVVQNKLVHLENENSVSRRRVRELEIELEACKKEVARERTRILEHEQSMMREDVRNKRIARERMEQEKKKAEDDQAELAAAETRYKSAVEEKKGNVVVIGTLHYSVPC